MADVLEPVHPLAGRTPALRELSATLGDALSVLAEPVAAALSLRRAPGDPTLPAPNTWTATPDGWLAWLGPDEYLAVSTAAAPHVWERDLRDQGVTAVDVSAQRVTLRLRGDRVRELLSFGCALDLRPARFPAGSAAQTTLGQAGVLLLALALDDIRIVVRTSFADYLVDWLLDAAQEFRPDPT